MTFAELRTEVEARGYDYVQPSRIDLWLKQAYEWVCSLQPWPFLEYNATGGSPLVIMDMTQIMFVAGELGELPGKDIRDVLSASENSPDTGGSAVAWYLDQNTVRTWPESGEQLEVRYIRTPPEYSDVDTPLVPEAYQELLVDGGVLRGLKDNDEYDTANALQGVIDLNISGMTEALMVRNYQNDQNIVQTGFPQDYST